MYLSQGIYPQMLARVEFILLMWKKNVLSLNVNMNTGELEMPKAMEKPLDSLE